jgi:polyribonucleotide nucleotidyltransferase
MPGKEGLLHISEIDWKRYETMEETGLKEGDKISVKLLDIDQKTGKFKLSAKVLKEKPEGYVEPERRPRPERHPDGAKLERPARGPRPEKH